LENRLLNKIEEILDRLYPNPPIPLNHTSAYTLLIAVLLSAQCTDERVNKVTKILFQLANTPETMARLEVQTIKNCIHSLGLASTKAKAIHNLSLLLLENFNGEVPSSLEDLISLPGVGRKTAQVVQAQIFHIPAFPVDTHIHRLAKRWGLTKGKTVLEAEKDLKNFFKKEKWIKRHLQMIYFGREYCTAKGHIKENCPLCKLL
jgi:endonuclease III